jgi:hypothetical protein
MESKRTFAYMHRHFSTVPYYFAVFLINIDEYFLDFPVKKQGRQDLLNVVNQMLKKLLYLFDFGFIHYFRGGE